MSTVTESLSVGVTRTDEGVPVGLINYMVLRRMQQPATKVRVGTETGFLWFSFKLTHCKVNTHIWSRS